METPPPASPHPEPPDEDAASDSEAAEVIAGGAEISEPFPENSPDAPFPENSPGDFVAPAFVPEPAVPPLPGRGKDMFKGLSVLTLAFAGCMALSLWGMHHSTPKRAPEPSPPTAERLPGFPDEFRPFGALSRARELTVRSKFQGFVAGGVRPDGTMDFADEATFVRYSFRSGSGIGPQPEREGGTLPTRRFCGQQSVFVKKEGLFADDDQPSRPCPKDDPEELALPKNCTLKKVWKTAMKRKISTHGEARIEYYLSEKGPAFRFSKDRSSFVVLADGCTRVLVGADQRGSVP